MCILASIPIFKSVSSYARFFICLFLHGCVLCVCVRLFYSTVGVCRVLMRWMWWPAAISSHRTCCTLLNALYCCCCRQPAPSIDVCQFVARNLHLYLIFFFFFARSFVALFLCVVYVYVCVCLCVNRMLTFYFRIIYSQCLYTGGIR